MTAGKLTAGNLTTGNLIKWEENMFYNADKKDVLYVQMFGTFSLMYNGVNLTGGGKSSESQFTYLMELVLHNREKGVSKALMEHTLFEDRELDNVHHAMRSVIYNAKKRLRDGGLPKDSNLIEQKKGVYYWTKDVEVIEDASEFDRVFEEAEAETDKDRKLVLYLDAVHRYTGEFLGNHGTFVWAAQEARRYRARFSACVEGAAELLRESQSFLQMEELGIYAAKLNPLADWETITMEALVSMGRYDDARKLYEETVDLYFKEQGLRPSDSLMILLDRLGSQIDHQYALLDDIQETLEEKQLPIVGGYLCTYPVFQGVYRIVKRLMERGGQSVFLMLCTVVDTKGNPMRDGPMLETLTQRLGDSIQHSIRHGDSLNRYGKGQYIVLLVNTTLENCKIIQQRINQNFIIGRQRTGVQYYVNSVICGPGVERPSRLKKDQGKDGGAKNGKH